MTTKLSPQVLPEARPATSSNPYQQMRQAFEDRYYQKIVPAVRPFETSRKIRLILAALISGILVAGGAWMIYPSFTNGTANKDTLCLALFFLVGAYFAWWLIKKSFENKIKAKIMPVFCQCFGHLKWDHDFYGDSRDFEAAGVIPHYSSGDYDDIFKGLYHNVAIEIVEAEYDIKRGRHECTVFDGVIIKLKMNKRFKTHTVIKPDTWLNISPVKRLKHTELEDPIFNKKFDVYTDNELEARYLITPTFMERLKAMTLAFHAKTASCAFYQRSLIIALPTRKDLFSIGSLIRKIDDYTQYVRMYKEMESIVRLIDYFKLNQKTGI